MKHELITAVLTKLKTIFDLRNMPGIEDMREIAHALSHVYPAMFSCLEGGVSLKFDQMRQFLYNF